MKPLFTVHGGEYLAASYIERRFRRVHVWIPSRDTGIDLLVSDKKNRRTLSLQVKFSKDWLVTHMKPQFQEHLRACGWWTINAGKLRASKADYWVFVLLGFGRLTTDFVIVPTKKLHRRMHAIHGAQRTIRSYLWVTKENRCWETRGLSKGEQLKVARGDNSESKRDFSKWLNSWGPVARLNA